MTFKQAQALAELLTACNLVASVQASIEVEDAFRVKIDVTQWRFVYVDKFPRIDELIAADYKPSYA